ncbi:MAG: substrate-binding domain-containing protein, partial [Chloroflexota bacterium]
KPFSAVFAADDLLAAGMLAALKERGLSIPADVSVVGFDDIRLASYTTPALTTIRQPSYEMGRCAAELLIDAASQTSGTGPAERVIFQGELVVRDSTAAPAAVKVPVDRSGRDGRRARSLAGARRLQ